jgi:ferritin
MSKKRDEDFKGFQEVISELDIKVADISPKKGKGQTGLELLWFLENEEKRVEKLGELYSEKIDNFKNFNFTDNMCHEQIEDNRRVREKILSKLSQENSGFYKNLNEYFRIRYS